MESNISELVTLKGRFHYPLVNVHSFEYIYDKTANNKISYPIVVVTSNAQTQGSLEIEKV